MRRPVKDTIDLSGDLRIWVTHLGDLKASGKTHGSRFLHIYSAMRSAGEVPADLNPYWWTQSTLGSVPPDADTPEWDEADNPGWEFNEFAVRALGWIRVTIDRGFTGKIEINLALDHAKVSLRAIDTVIDIITQVESASPQVGIVLDDMPLADADSIKRDLRELRRDVKERQRLK